MIQICTSSAAESESALSPAPAWAQAQAGAVDASHRFAGTLQQADHACVRDLWQMSLHLQDDDGRCLFVYLALGRGDAGAAACRARQAELIAGRRYWGSATLHSAVLGRDYYTGRVSLQADHRRPSLPACALRLAASGGRAIAQTRAAS